MSTHAKLQIFRSGKWTFSRRGEESMAKPSCRYGLYLVCRMHDKTTIKVYRLGAYLQGHGELDAAEPQASARRGSLSRFSLLVSFGIFHDLSNQQRTCAMLRFPPVLARRTRRAEGWFILVGQPGNRILRLYRTIISQSRILGRVVSVCPFPKTSLRRSHYVNAVVSTALTLVLPGPGL